MGVQLTGLGAVLALLWILSDSWEWSITEALEGRIQDWKKRWYNSQAIVRFVIRSSIFEQEQFVYSIRRLLPKLEGEFGGPVYVEIEIDGQDIDLSEEEIRYISCLTRSFSEFTWQISQQVECEAE